MSSIAISKSAAASLPASAVSQTNEPLILDATTLQSNLNRQPFIIGHNLSNHPLFTLSRLIELSTSLPEDCVAYNSGDVSLSQGLYRGPRNGLSIEETIRQIEECRSWMVLKFVEKNPEYKELLDECLDQIGETAGPIATPMMKREGFVFISSPGSITPLHVDPEYNFLLQIRGRKIVNIIDPADRSVLSESDLERYYTAPSGEFVLGFEERFRERARVFELEPGRGLHFPVTAPHWVENGSQVSISFSITFETPFCERRKTLYALNSRLRKLGVRNPISIGRSNTIDNVKYFGLRALSRAKRLLTKP